MNNYVVQVDDDLWILPIFVVSIQGIDPNESDDVGTIITTSRTVLKSSWSPRAVVGAIETAQQAIRAARGE